LAIPVDPIPILGRPTRGSIDAKLVVVEYSEFQCPYCGAFARDVLPTIVRDYVETGKVRLVFKNTPLPMHEFASSAGVAALCADKQGKFWEMHDRLFSQQDRLADNDVRNVAAQLGLGLMEYDQCHGGRAAVQVIDADSAEARSFGITGTPTFVFGTLQPDGRVKGSDILAGAKPIAAFRAILDRVPALVPRSR
jgi:protein-disulfide isomerase